MSPEEEELRTKREELERLTTQLSERELELPTLRAELDAFHRRYMRSVGSRYSRLDWLEAEVARLKARLHPHDAAAQAEANLKLIVTPDPNGHVHTPSLDELDKELDQLDLALPTLPTDFSRADIYDAHD